MIMHIFYKRGQMIIIHVEPICFAPPELAPRKLSVVAQHLNLFLGNCWLAKYTVNYISKALDHQSTTITSSSVPKPKRQRTLPTYFSDSIVTAKMPVYHKPSTVEELRALPVYVIDSFERELEGRFADENTKLWDSLKNLLPTSDHFLDPLKLKPLFEYVLTIPWFDYLLKKFGRSVCSSEV